MFRVQSQCRTSREHSVGSRRAGQAAWRQPGFLGTPMSEFAATPKRGRTLFIHGPEASSKIAEGQLEPRRFTQGHQQDRFWRRSDAWHSAGWWTLRSSVQATTRRPPSGAPRARRRSASSWSGAAGARPRRHARGSRATARRGGAPRRARRRNYAGAPGLGLGLGSGSGSGSSSGLIRVRVRVRVRVRRRSCSGAPVGAGGVR